MSVLLLGEASSSSSSLTSETRMIKVKRHFCPQISDERDGWHSDSAFIAFLNQMPISQVFFSCYSVYTTL